MRRESNSRIPGLKMPYHDSYQRSNAIKWHAYLHTGQALGDRAYRQKKDHLIAQSTYMPGPLPHDNHARSGSFSSHPPASIVVTGQWIARWIAGRAMA